MGTNLAYDMLCEPTCLDNKEKEGYNLSGNRLITLKILTTNIEYFASVPNICSGEGSSYEIRRGKIPGKIISYIEDYYDLNPANERKGIS